MTTKVIKPNRHTDTIQNTFSKKSSIFAKILKESIPNIASQFTA